MKAILLQYKQWIIISIVVIIILSVVYYKGKTKGKNSEKGKNSQNQGKVPSETDWGKDAHLTSAESQQASLLAKRLFEAMDGVQFTRDRKPFVEYLAANDRIFVATANTFYNNYGNGKNLAQWIDGEFLEFTKIGLGTTGDNIIKRLATFGIKVK